MDKDKDNKVKKNKVEEIKVYKKPKASSKDINVVLDLDNTLIFSIPFNKVPKIMPEWLTKFKTHKMHFGKEKDPEKYDYLVVERPGLRPFLNWLSKYFKITIWSAASPDYVLFIKKHIFGKRKVQKSYTSDDCERSQKNYGEDFIKNLELLWDVDDLKGYGPSNTVIIDDLKYNTKPQPHNSIHIKKFIVNVNDKKSLEDIELVAVQKKLEQIKTHYKNNVNNRDSFHLVL
jgi:TFIIF-interacting CTD phosphatase-like protein